MMRTLRARAMCLVLAAFSATFLMFVITSSRKEQSSTKNVRNNNLINEEPKHQDRLTTESVSSTIKTHDGMCRQSDKTTIYNDYQMLETTNLSAYIRPDQVTTLIEPNDLCGTEQIYLLLGIHSAVSHFEKRRVIRATWGRDLLQMRPDIRMMFIIGRTNYPDVISRIVDEAFEHDDMLQEDFCDSYFNMTLKAVFLLKWTIRHCPQAKYFFRNDDDTIVRPTNLMTLLKQYDDGTREMHRMDWINPGMSYFLLGANPQRGADVQRNPKSQWYVPKSIYPEFLYPDYYGGSCGFVTSGSLLPWLYQESLQTRYMHTDDVFLTGVVAARKLNLTLDGHPGFANYFRCNVTGLVSGSGYHPKVTETLWRKWANQTRRAGHPTQFYACRRTLGTSLTMNDWIAEVRRIMKGNI